MIQYPSYSEFPSEQKWTGTGRGDCPNVDRYHAADCNSTEFEVLELVAAFVRALQPEMVIETGACFGYGTQAIGRALQANGHGHLVSIEWNMAYAIAAAKRVEGLPVTVVQGSSLDWLPKEANIGFAFFDSETDIRTAEFLRYLPFMTRGAIVAFHDTGPQHATWGYVQGLEQRGVLKAINLRTPRGVAFAQVLND